MVKAAHSQTSRVKNKFKFTLKSSKFESRRVHVLNQAFSSLQNGISVSTANTKPKNALKH